MEIFEKVSNILTEISGVEHICPDDQLRADLVLDSIQMVSLLIALEENFQIVLDESDMNPFDLIVVWQVVDLVKKYIGGDSNEKST